MPKATTIFLIIVFSVAGIVLGNLYGRRDVANSRPPAITGSLGNPSSITVDNFQVVLLRDGAQIYGAAAVASKQVILNISAPTLSGKFKLVLLSQDGAPVAELTSLALSAGRNASFKANLPRSERGDYLALFPENSGSPVLVSEKFE